MTTSDHPHSNPDCRAVSELLSRVGDKWTVLIVKALSETKEGHGRRFNELKRAIGGISQQMLTRTLKTLERDGMVARTVHATVPPSRRVCADAARSLARGAGHGVGGLDLREPAADSRQPGCV